MVGNIEALDPGPFLDELKIGRRAIELNPQNEREDKRKQRGKQRRPAGIATDYFRAPVANEENRNRADQGQKRNDAQNGKVIHDALTRLAYTYKA